MSFSVPRAELLDLVAKVMEVPPERRSALLGRFQHLQRLSLIKGINPGRGSAAEYKANHLIVVLIAFQMLQLGVTPERAVTIIQQNQDRIRLSIGLSLAKRGTITPAMLWFDPSILTQNVSDGRGKTYDIAEATFHYGGAGTGHEMFDHFFVKGSVQRMAFISVSGTLWHLATALDWDDAEFDGFRPVIGEKSARFLAALGEWFDGSTPDSLA